MSAANLQSSVRCLSGEMKPNADALRTTHTTAKAGRALRFHVTASSNSRAPVSDLQAAPSYRTLRSNSLVPLRTECAVTPRELCSSYRVPQTTRLSSVLRTLPSPRPVAQRRSLSEMRVSREDPPSERSVSVGPGHNVVTLTPQSLSFNSIASASLRNGSR